LLPRHQRRSARRAAAGRGRADEQGSAGPRRRARRLRRRTRRRRGPGAGGDRGGGGLRLGPAGAARAPARPVGGAQGRDRVRVTTRPAAARGVSAMSETIDTLIVGAGQAGLALSRLLAARGREHLVVERGRVAERWRSERWVSFRLLTPSWLTRLPGRAYAGPEPDGFLGRDEVVDFFEGYARSFAAPVRTGVTVRDARRVGGRWHVTTAHGLLRADVLVAATGGLGQPVVPAGLAAALPASVAQLHSSRYRNPDALPDGAVLVVGSGPSGQQIARE